VRSELVALARVSRISKERNPKQGVILSRPYIHQVWVSRSVNAEANVMLALPLNVVLFLHLSCTNGVSWSVSGHRKIQQTHRMPHAGAIPVD